MYIRILGLSLFAIVFSQSAFALTLKGKLSVASGNRSDFTIVAQDPNSEAIVSDQVATNGRFVLRGVKANARMTLLENGNVAGVVVAAVKSGKKYFTLKRAQAKSKCDDAGAVAIMAVRKAPVDSKKNPVSLNLVFDRDLSTGYLKNTIPSKYLAKTVTADISADSCAPAGADGSGALAVHRIATANDGPPTAGDADGDGQEDSNDQDDDNDGYSDTFDPDNDGDGTLDDTDADNNDKTQGRVWNFQQLHLDLENAYNTRVMSVSAETIDNGLRTYGGLAVQVVAGQTVELNCGSAESGLSYCRPGGTGRLLEPHPDGLELPEGTDSDNDGKAEITAGQTGDLQVRPGASSSEILPGDTFIEESDDGTGKVTEYVGTINSVVHDVPGIVSIETALGTTNFSWPLNANSAGSMSNPILVPSTGDVLVTVTTYTPHYRIADGTRVVPGKIKMIANIPNGPCTFSAPDQCVSAGSGPGLLPGALFSNPSSGWEVVSDGVQSLTETNTAEGDDGTVTYTMNLAGSGGVTGWDSGEQVKVPIQSLDNNGGTAAINVWFKRQ